MKKSLGAKKRRMAPKNSGVSVYCKRLIIKSFGSKKNTGLALFFKKRVNKIIQRLFAFFSAGNSVARVSKGQHATWVNKRALAIKRSRRQPFSVTRLFIDIISKHFKYRGRKSTRLNSSH